MSERKERLERQLLVEIEKLSTMEDGSEEKTATINGINQMYRLIQEDSRIEVEGQTQKRDRFIGYIFKGVEIGTIVVSGIIIPVVFLNRGFKFEETGTYTSKTFQTLFNKFKLK